LSLEITNDSRSERFRDTVARAIVEILGHDLQYGPWTVILRSERKTLCVVMTGPDDTREEWAFNLEHSRAHGPAEMAAQLRQRFRAGNGRTKR
jgi:hypothetical protein